MPCNAWDLVMAFFTRISSYWRSLLFPARESLLFPARVNNRVLRGDEQYSGCQRLRHS